MSAELLREAQFQAELMSTASDYCEDNPERVALHAGLLSVLDREFEVPANDALDEVLERIGEQQPHDPFGGLLTLRDVAGDASGTSLVRVALEAKRLRVRAGRLAREES